MAQLSTPPPVQGGRPRRWVAKLHSRDLAEKWAALQTAVPCLHPSHKFQKVVEGPERAVVFTSGHSGSTGSSSGGTSAPSVSNGAATTAAALDEAVGAGQEQPGQAVDEAAAALAAVSLQQSQVDAAGAAAAAQPSGSERLEEFLATFRPSACSCSDVAWLVVEVGSGSGSGSSSAPPASGSSSAAQAGPSLEERVDAAVEEWEKLAASGRKLAAADVDHLAAKHRILKGEHAEDGGEQGRAGCDNACCGRWRAERSWMSAPGAGACLWQPSCEPQLLPAACAGKWMLFARSGEEADAAWPAVARAVCGSPAGAGQAGAAPLCGSAKVSSTAPPLDDSHVFCCYVDNYQARLGGAALCMGGSTALPMAAQAGRCALLP